MAESPLRGVRIVDLTDERGIYGAKLLADMGADVVRPEPPEGDALRTRGPYLGTDGASLWYAFFATSRRILTIDLQAASDESAPANAQLQQLVQRADIVLTCDGAFAVHSINIDAARVVRPSLVEIAVSSFGDSGPWRDLLAPDLIAGALGGTIAPTGAPDTTPLKTFGELNFMVSGVYTAIAALSALNHARTTGIGQRVAVPVHECIASCLEQVLMLNWYGEKMGRGRVLPRQAGTHWSMAYTVMPAKTGAIMVTPAPDVEAQLLWLIEEDVHQDLLDPKYAEPANRPLLIARVMQILRGWVATKDAEALFFEAQARHAPYGWVLPIERLADNPQLTARDWWVPLQLDGRTVNAPGAPYRFSATPAQPRDAVHVDAEALLSELGWTATELGRNVGAARAASPDAPSAHAPQQNARPLEGLRVLDFTHVLAGPFATRVLGDMGADVVKVNSHERALVANSPESPYYTMWNRNKRALALDMKNDAARALCRRLCATADIVIDNFAVGVLDRWGVGYTQVQNTNPGVIYAQMSGMGEGGPWSGFVTYAPTIHALTGLTHLTSVPGREDIGIGYSYNDHQAGLHGAVALLAALEARRRTGRGQRVDLSQFEVGVNFLGPSLLDWFGNGRAARPVGNRLPYDAAAPHGVYPCLPRDDKRRPGLAAECWVAIACLTDAQWRSLCAVMGDPMWAQAPMFATAKGRAAAAETLDQHLSVWTQTQSANDVMARCQAAGIPAGTVQDGIDLAEQDPQLRHAHFLQRIDDVDPVLGQTFADRLPLHFNKTPCDTYRRVRHVGEDNAAVLRDWLGMSEAEVRRGEDEGVLR